MKFLKTTMVTVLASSLLFAGCGNKEEGGQTSDNKEKTNLKIGMVTDTNGIDDKAFNQSAWEGLSTFSEEHGLKLNDDIKYIQSQSEADFVPNLTLFADQGFPLIYGIGFFLKDAMTNVAAEYPNAQFVMVDDVVDAPNVTSVTFKENEGAFLAGVAAALTTKTNKVGFVGGIDSEVVQRFKTGFEAGVKAAKPDVKVISQFAGSFGKPEAGSQIASNMYGQGVDVIFHAAGGTGNGIFTEAKNRKKNGEDVWVIGVDRDQTEEGMPENVTLTSMVKRVDEAVKEVADRAAEGTLKGEHLTFGLKEEGVDLLDTDNLSDDVEAKVEEFQEKIMNGDITVPEK